MIFQPWGPGRAWLKNSGKIAPLKQSTACHPWSKMVKNITETCACLPHSTRSSKTSAISVKTQRAESTSEPLWLDRKRHKMRLVALSRTTSGCSHNGKAHVTGDHPWIHDQETSKRKSSDSEAFKLYRFSTCHGHFSGLKHGVLWKTPWKNYAIRFQCHIHTLGYDTWSNPVSSCQPILRMPYAKSHEGLNSSWRAVGLAQPWFSGRLLTFDTFHSSKRNSPRCHAQPRCKGSTQLRHDLNLPPLRDTSCHKVRHLWDHWKLKSSVKRAQSNGSRVLLSWIQCARQQSPGSPV